MPFVVFCESFVVYCFSGTMDSASVEGAATAGSPVSGNVPTVAGSFVSALDDRSGEGATDTSARIVGRHLRRNGLDRHCPFSHDRRPTCHAAGCIESFS